MELKVGSKVKFDTEEQKGYGTVVAIVSDKSSENVLVYGSDILNGHNGNSIEHKQNNNCNWWFDEDELELVYAYESEEIKQLKEEVAMLESRIINLIKDKKPLDEMACEHYGLDSNKFKINTILFEPKENQ